LYQRKIEQLSLGIKFSNYLEENMEEVNLENFGNELFAQSKDSTKVLQFALVNLSDLREILNETINSNPPQSVGNPEPKERLLNIDEAAEFFDVSSQTIHSWKNKGTIPFYRMAGRIYFKETELLGALKKVEITEV
jgi:excisionase family DNA binding protein